MKIVRFVVRTVLKAARVSDTTWKVVCRLCRKHLETLCQVCIFTISDFVEDRVRDAGPAWARYGWLGVGLGITDVLVASCGILCHLVAFDALPFAYSVSGERCCQVLTSPFK